MLVACGTAVSMRYPTVVQLSAAVLHVSHYYYPTRQIIAPIRSAECVRGTGPFSLLFAKRLTARFLASCIRVHVSSGADA